MRWKLLLIGLVVIASGCIDNGQTESSDIEDLNQTSTPTEPAADNSEYNTVYLTESGFQPMELTIQQGETVTWINNASTDMWIASDNHPTHTNYAGSAIYQHCQMGDQTEPAFDQCQTGEEFRFTFEKTGEWGYHNHERAGQIGTIIVE